MFNRKIRQTMVSCMVAVAITVGGAPLQQNVQVAAETTEETNLQVMGVTFDQSSPKASGTRLTIGADCFGGTGNYVYTYKVRRPSGTYETIAQDTDSVFVNYTVNEVGIYNFSVTVSDGVDSVSEVNEFVVKPSKVVIDSVKLNKSTFKKNDKVKFTVATTAASGTVKTKIDIVTPSGKKVTVKKYSTKKTATYKATQRGTYKATIYAKDSKSSTKVTKCFQVK